MAKPSDLGQYWETFTTSEGERYYYLNAKEKTQYELPSAPAVILPQGWQPYASEDGEPYFFNEVSNATSWDLPTGHSILTTALEAGVAAGRRPEELIEKTDDLALFWETFHDASGEPYYYNEKTGVTTYDFPETPVLPARATDGRALLPVVLPRFWYPAANGDGEVYFVRDDPSAPESEMVTSWDLPAGSSNAQARLIPASGRGTARPRETRAEKARRILREGMLGWKAKKDAGVAQRIQHRPWMFRKKEDDSYITLNPAEREVLRKVLADPGFQLVGVLPREDALKYGFADANTAAAKAPACGATSGGLWNAALDPSSGKTYYFNVETKQAAWALPPGGRVVARVVPKAADVVHRATLMAEAKAIVKARRAERSKAAEQAAATMTRPGGAASSTRELSSGAGASPKPAAADAAAPTSASAAAASGAAAAATPSGPHRKRARHMTPLIVLKLVKDTLRQLG